MVNVASNCKELRSAFELRLLPGDWLQILGEKLNLKAGNSKPSESYLLLLASERLMSKLRISKNYGKYLSMSKRSSCMKRVAQRVCHALKRLFDRGLESCKSKDALKQCKKLDQI